MEVPEAGVHSFIVRIWLEEDATQDTPAVWRGHVTHLMSGTRRYFGQLSELCAFITLYLDEMDAKSTGTSQ